MSQNLHQIFISNPATVMAATDELYLIRSPFGITDDFAITWANMLASIAAQASGTWGISISGNAATATSATTAGSATTATTATNATNVGTTANSTNASFYPLFVSSNAGGNQAAQLGTGLSFNPSTNALTTTTFVGALSGNATSATTAGSATTATTATNATNVGTTANSSNASFYPLFVASNAGGNQAAQLGTGMSFNPSTNTLTTTTFVGALTGNASTATSAGSATTATTATNANNGATVAVSTNASFFPLFVASSTNGNQAFNLGTGLSFNPSTNALTTTTFIGALTGNASTATSAANALTWNSVAGTTQAAAVQNGYVIANASATTVTLPATAALGSIVAVQGLGAAGWVLTANTGQTIKLGSSTTSSAGTLTSTNQYDAIEVVCIVANTTWATRSVIGNLTVA